MGKSLTLKIIEKKIISGDLSPTNEIAIKIDQTLTQDSTGTMAYLQLMRINPSEIKVKNALAYVDHNMLQTGFENMDDHEFIRSICKKYGITYSKPGNGVCHQLHLENFSKPGETLLGSDSHTPTCGAMGMIAIGAGGLDIATALSTGKYYFKAPHILNIKLEGELIPPASAKDVILFILKEYGVKGGIGKIIEYTGSGASSLSLTQRATICNMGAELGATTSIFETDEKTYEYLDFQGRSEDFIKLKADVDAKYDQFISVDLSSIKPMIAKPHNPDNVYEIANINGIKVNQVAIGSCTNSSYEDLTKAAAILKNKKVSEHVSLVIAPGSSSILSMLAKNGALCDLIDAGARILECGCGPCIGMGQAPNTNGVSLRTFNRNFKGRSGTDSADIYLVSPEVAAASALKGYITKDVPVFDIGIYKKPSLAMQNSGFFIRNIADKNQKIIIGPNIKELPVQSIPNENLEFNTVFIGGDNISTDDITPSDSKMLPFRSNIEYLSSFCLTRIDEDFPKRAKNNNPGLIVAGENYGQGSSREHAALTPAFLGIKAVLVKSFARIHKSNLINNGIIPLTFENPSDYEHIKMLDKIKLSDISINIGSKDSFQITINEIPTKVRLEISQRERDILLQGGFLNYISMKGENY
ncbi:aconitate hydratase [Proteocatella sphenisci]|uniref:aconitate hydratase n=1 Tax=Proteocatella sphenisci TaxID=181070 RepID=UPI00048FF621|nr:aconitate hydratase [Proteocatella sphenisci]